MNRIVSLATTLFGVAVLLSGGFSPIPVEAQPHQPATVAATVGDEKILVSQVEHEFATRFGNREISGALAAELRREILHRLVRQHLVLSKFAGSAVAATDDEVDLEVARLTERLTQIEKTLDEFLAEKNQSRHGLRFNLRWQIAWKRYLDRTLTDEVLQQYFQRHRRQFDGTQLRVAHILLRLDENADAAAVRDATSRSESLRGEIVSGQRSWDQAVTRFSDAPSASKAGDIGKIGRDGPMPKSFTDAAFQLQKDEISPPVRTRFGVHLIRCLDEEPGQARWDDVRKPVRRAAAEELFGRIAARQRAAVEVRLIEPGLAGSSAKKK